MNIETEKNQETRAFWDANPCGTASSWEHARAVRFDVTDPYLLEYLVAENFRDRKVLEVGCGQGVDANEIVKYAASYIGIDLSSESVKIAEQEVIRRNAAAEATFKQMDAERLEFESETFDTVYSCGVLHHTENFDEAIDQIHRVLKDDGTFLMMLYRSYTPLWVVLRLVRGAMRIPIVGAWIKVHTLAGLRERESDEESLAGTALMELVGCPVIRTYSKTSLRRHLKGKFRIEETQAYRVGLDQAIRIMPKVIRKRWPTRWFDRLESRFGNILGFYLVAKAVKIGGEHTRST